MLEFHALQETPAPPARLAALLQEFHAVLQDRGMADMDEYGDMLKWGLPKRDGLCRNFHVYHPDWCSFSDRFRGTIHYHPGKISGTILAGAMEHYTYEAHEDADGDRFLAGKAYTLIRHTRHQAAGTSYGLPARVPHWLRPTALTITYFEEEDTDEMGDLLEPEGIGTDEHRWSQADAEALLPVLLELTRPALSVPA